MNSQKMDTQTCRLLLIENKADLDILNFHEGAAKSISENMVLLKLTL